MNKNKSTKKIKFVNRYSLFFVLICFIFGKTIYNQSTEKNKLNSKIAVLEEKKEKLNTEIDNIKKDIQDKDSEEFVVKIAREKLKMIKKNEVIIKYKN